MGAMDHRWTLILLVTTVACGAQVSDEMTTDDGGSGSTSGTTTAPNPSSSTSADPGTGTADSSGTGLPAECQGYDNEESTAETTIEFRNDTDASLLLETNCGRDYLSISNDFGWRWPGDFCGTTCQDMFLYGCNACDGCATDSYQVVSPGATLSIPWAGLLYERASPSPSCLRDGSFCNGGSSCAVLRNAAPAGDVSVRIVAIRQAACEEVAEDPSTCVCPDGEQVCESSIGGESVVATAEYTAEGTPGGVLEVVAAD